MLGLGYGLGVRAIALGFSSKNGVGCDGSSARRRHRIGGSWSKVGATAPPTVC
ncbi:MAG: hypothetical protein V7L09_11595 [Nostoc sp.]